jgi:hypothetical protein
MVAPSDEHLEFGRYNEGFIPEPFFEQATRELSNYFVSFSVDDRPSGSATLVNVDGHYGVLTAAHVVDDWFGSASKCIAVVCAPHLHQLLLPKQHIEVTRYGPSKDPFSGPDLAFVRLRDIKCLGALKARKSFYPLSISYRPEIFEKIQPRACTICFVAGAPAEMAKGEGVPRTKSHILESTHFFGRAQVIEEFSWNSFDYLKLVMLAGHSGFPRDYGGVSGGGVWHVPFAIDPEVGTSSLRIERPELIGVAFCQSDLVNDSRSIFAHGIKSVYSVIRSH